MKSRPLEIATSACTSFKSGSGLWLFDGEDLVCGDICESLNRAAGPGDLDFFDVRIRANAEVNARVAGTRVADGRCRFVPLGATISGDDFDLRAKTHAVAACADEAQQKPMLALCTGVTEKFDGLVETGDDGVDASGVEDVAKGRAAMCAGNLEAGPCAGTDVLKLAVAEIAEDGVGLRVGLRGDGLLNVVHDVGASDEEVLPAVIVEVVNAVAPTGHAVGEWPQAAGVVGIDECTAALIDVEREFFVLDSGVPDVRQAIVVDVAEIGSHAGESVAIGRVGNTGGDGNLFKLLSANVAEEEVGHGVVGYEGREKAAAVDIGEGHCHALAEESVDAGFVRDVSECAVAIIAIESVVQRQVKIGMAVGAQALFERAEGILVDLPMAVVDDKEIEQSIVVVVEPARSDGPHFLAMGVRSSDAGFGCYVGEGSVAVVAKELVAGNIGDEDVRIAVVVEVADGDAHAVACASDTRFFSDVGECAVMVIAEEAIPVSRCRLFKRRDLGAVDAVNVEKAVVVEVKQSDTGNHGFGLVLVGCSAVASYEVEARSLGDLVEANAWEELNCTALRKKGPKAARGYCGCSNEAESLKEATALKT